MSIAQQQIAASIRTVTIGDTTYKFRRVSSADIIKAGGAFLLALEPRAREATPEIAAEGVVGEADTARAKMLAALQRDPALLSRGHDFSAAVVCAAVFAASADGGTTWESYQLVLDPRQENGAQGRAHISVLGHAVGLLARHVMALINHEEAPTGDAATGWFPRRARGGAEGAGGADRDVLRRGPGVDPGVEPDAPGVGDRVPPGAQGV